MGISSGSSGISGRLVAAVAAAMVYIPDSVFPAGRKFIKVDKFVR